MKRTGIFVSVLLGGMLLFAMAACAAGYDAYPAPFGEAKTVNYTLITSTWANNPRVTAIAIEYDRILQSSIDLRDHFAVTAELQELTDWLGRPITTTSRPKALRHITKAYTSAVKEPGKISFGKYVILELNDQDDNGSSIFVTNDALGTAPRQAVTVNSGWMLLPYRDKMVYEITQLRAIKYQPDWPYYEGSSENTGTNITFQRVDEYPILTVDEFVRAYHEYSGNPITIRIGATSETNIQVGGATRDVDSIAYHLYSPSNPVPGKKYPLVMFLHGSSARSDQILGTEYEEFEVLNNMKPLLVNQGATTWIENGTKDCYVLVPQYENDLYPIVKELFQTIVNDTSKSIDKDRLYVAGVSMGGVTSWRFLADPDFDGQGTNLSFSAAVISCGYPQLLTPYDGSRGSAIAFGSAVTEQENADLINKLVEVANRTNIWLIHADKDPTVPVRGARLPYRIMTGNLTAANFPLANTDGSGTTADTFDQGWGVPLTEVLVGAVDAAALPAGERTGDKRFDWRSTVNNNDIRYTEMHLDPNARNVDVNVFAPSPHEICEWAYWEPEIPQWLFAN